MTYRYPGGVVRKTAANTSITGASGVWDLGSQAQAVRTNTWPISGLANPISGSLRFRKSATAYLSRTPSSTGSQTTWTWSGWVKQSLFGTSGTQWLLTSGNSGSIPTNYTFLSFSVNGFAGNADQLQFYSTLSNSTVFAFESTARFRDPAAWYHVVAVVDTTQATDSNRIKLYINGVQVTAFALSTYPAQNTSIPFINSSSFETRIGAIITYGSFDGYMSEVNFVDGQALTPSSFGQTSPITGVWEPIKYTGTYGTNGFYLSLSDTSSIGKDFSGNGNNWTPNNISTANDSTFDLMRDVPTQYTPQGVTDVGGTVRGNYCTLNAALQAGGYTLNDGNLNWARTGATGGPRDRSQFGTFGVTSGKWYWEFTAGTVNSNSIPGFGIAIGGLSTQSWLGGQTGSYFYESDALKYLNTVSSSYGASFSTGDVIGVAFDADDGTLTFYKNGTSQGQAASGLTSGPYFPAVTRTVGGGGSNGTEIANFGQQPFAYAPPTGFKSLCTTNLPTPTIGATVATAANKYFDVTIWSGDNASPRAITNSGLMQPDWVWVKRRNGSAEHILFDAVRGFGGNKELSSNTTGVEGALNTSLYGFVSATNSTGFQLTAGSTDSSYTNRTGDTYVGWQWNAGGSTVTNTVGSITSQVRANPTAGFSVVTYTGTSANATVGHGLGVAPSMLITKPRSSADSWISWHTALGGTGYFYLDLTNASATAATVWNSTTPTSTVFSLGANGGVNASGVNFVAYCFAQVAGYSAFGSYTGNGSTDGPFVHTGFRPRFILTKAIQQSSQWFIWDAAREPDNPNNSNLFPESSQAETANNSALDVDFLSNGFKIRNTGSGQNNSGYPYIYMAFAEHPFKNALAR